MANPARIKLGLVAALCIALAALGFLVAKPDLLDESNIRSSLISRLSAWTGADVSINGAINIQYLPRLIVEFGDVQVSGITRIPAIKNITAKNIQVRLGLWSMVSSVPIVDRITFVDPNIEAVANGVRTPSQPVQTPNIVDAISKAPFDEFVIDNGTVVVSGETSSDTFSDVTVKINLETDGTHNLRGNVTWRTQKLTFNYEGGVPEILTSLTRFPVTLNLSSKLVSANISGNTEINDHVRLNGSLSLNVPSLPRFARWTGVLIPEDQKRGDFSADGTFHWTGHRIGFDEGTFTLDGNRALGALALNFDGPRPKIDGTLALQRLNLTQYFKHGTKTAPASTTPDSSTVKSVDLGFPLLHHINFDLRISTTDLVAEPLELGQSALSVTLEAGKLSADIAVFELCGGSGNSRIELDATVPDSALRVSTSISGISARRCIELFIPASPLEGTAAITADVTTSGRTAQELIKGLRGKANIAVAAGSMSANVANLLTIVRKGPVTGWDTLSGGTTAFKLLKGEIFLRPNAIYSDPVMMDLGANSLVGEGTIDLSKQTLDLQLKLLAKAPDPSQTPKEDAKDEDRPKEYFVIKGPWSQPIFRSGRRESSAGALRFPYSVQTARQNAN